MLSTENEKMHNTQMSLPQRCFTHVNFEEKNPKQITQCIYTVCLSLDQN